MLIQVEHNSSRPITRQVIEQIHWLIVSGSLAPGARLPSIRELSKQLKVNPTTVTRIYAELAASGVIVMRQGDGAFVADEPLRPSRDQIARKVADLARAMLVEGLRHGLSKREIDQYVTAEYQKIRTASHGPARF
jgi:GntR family transcriptional regulator